MISLVMRLIFSPLLKKRNKYGEIKKDSPLGLIWKQGLADIEVEPSVPFNLLTPTTVLSNVTFNEDLKSEIYQTWPWLFTLMEANLTLEEQVAEFFMKTSTGEFRYRFRNPDHSSVFRSELTAISEALSLALDFKVPDVWILTDSGTGLTPASRSPTPTTSCSRRAGRTTSRPRSCAHQVSPLEIFIQGFALTFTTTFVWLFHLILVPSYSDSSGL
ncbi:RNase H domain-containing protein [Caerostris extrusa]|uniref:RNase H domain-containing protein n=1 Tax=Caerostris extrusa TaxID=172846 RepID=A0AAV4UFI5_CAEEX|nr:RNase H domain-containing protein [Caerostris extrusa]